MGAWEWVEGAAGALAKAAGTLAEALAVVSTVLVAATALALVATAVATRVPGVRRVVGAIPTIRRALQPKLRVEALDDGAVEGGAGTWLVAALRGAVPRQIAMDVGHDLDHVDGRSELARALSGLEQVSPAAGLVLGAVSAAGAILPRNHFVLTGTLQPDTGDGVGLALSLQRGSTVEGMVTLTTGALTAGQPATAQRQGADASATPGGVPAELAKLVEPAASWVHYCITRALDGSTAIASDGESFVFFRQGVRCEQEDPIRARLLYERALELDPTNAGALANLGQLNDQDGDHEHAIADLERSLALLQLPSNRRAPRDASGRLLATSAVDRTIDREDVLLEEGRRTPEGSEPLTEEALDSDRGDLLRRMKAALGPRRHEDPPSIAELIASVRPERNRPSPRSLYNLGFLLAKIALACGDSQAEAPDRTEVGQGRAEAQARTRPIAGDRAIATFERALERSDDRGRHRISEHACRDETLARLAREHEGGQRLADLFERHRKPPSSAALAQLPMIGAEGAGGGGDRLLARAHTPRIGLGQSAAGPRGGRERTIREWLDCYELLRLDGLGSGHLRALHAVGHRSPATLAAAGAARVQQQLEGLDGGHVAPSSELLAAWVAAAAHAGGRPTAPSRTCKDGAR